MRSYAVVVECDPETGLFVGYVPGWPGAHSQGGSLDELRENLQEVIQLLRPGRVTLAPIRVLKPREVVRSSSDSASSKRAP